MSLDSSVSCFDSSIANHWLSADEILSSFVIGFGVVLIRFAIFDCGWCSGGEMLRGFCFDVSVLVISSCVDILCCLLFCCFWFSSPFSFFFFSLVIVPSRDQGGFFCFFSCVGAEAPPSAKMSLGGYRLAIGFTSPSGETGFARKLDPCYSC